MCHNIHHTFLHLLCFKLVINNTNTTRAVGDCLKDGLDTKFCIPLLPLPQIPHSSDKPQAGPEGILSLNIYRRETNNMYNYAQVSCVKTVKRTDCLALTEV